MPKHDIDPVLDDFRSWYSLYVAPGTVANRAYYVSRLADWASKENLSLWSMTMQHLSTWLLTVGDKPATRKNAADALRVFYGWAVSARFTRTNPARELPKITVPRGLPRPTPETLLSRALETAPRIIDVLMLLLGSYGGLRAKEIAALHTHDIQHGRFRITGKGGHVRYVPIHPVLDELLTLFPTGFYFSSRRNPTGHYLPGSITQRLGGLLGPGWSGHSLRHHFATVFYDEHRDILALRDLLGHANVSTTMIYTQVRNSRLHDQVTQLPSIPGLNNTVARRRPLS